MTADIARWLADKLAEVEATARAAAVVCNVFHEDGHETKPNWSVYHQTVVIAGEEWRQTDDMVCNADDAPDYADHIAAWDPETVLRHVAASRKILELHGQMDPVSAEARVYPLKTDFCDVCVNWDEGDYEGPPPVAWPCDTVKLLAQMWGWEEQP
jgi:hypothetical protein